MEVFFLAILLIKTNFLCKKCFKEKIIQQGCLIDSKDMYDVTMDFI